MRQPISRCAFTRIPSSTARRSQSLQSSPIGTATACEGLWQASPNPSIRRLYSYQARQFLTYGGTQTHPSATIQRDRPKFLHTGRNRASPTFVRQMASASAEIQITGLRESDYEQWAVLFRAYIDFYKSAIDEAQYRRTFDRLLDPNKDLYGLVARSAKEGGKLVGFAHYYPHQTPWSEKMIMHLNDLFVDPSTRGTGLGRKLIQTVVEDSESKGCFRVEWSTQHGNPARKLYDQMATCDFVEYRVKLANM